MLHHLIRVLHITLYAFLKMFPLPQHKHTKLTFWGLLSALSSSARPEPAQFSFAPFSLCLYGVRDPSYTPHSRSDQEVCPREAARSCERAPWKVGKNGHLIGKWLPFPTLQRRFEQDPRTLPCCKHSTPPHLALASALPPPHAVSAGGLRPGRSSWCRCWNGWSEGLLAAQVWNFFRLLCGRKSSYLIVENKQFIFNL